MHCVAKSRSRPRREAPRHLAVERALKVRAGASRGLCRASAPLVVFEAADAVHLPL